MDPTYSVFGLSLRSNLPIPELVPELTRAAASGGKPDVEICLGLQPPAEPECHQDPEEMVFVSTDLSESGEPALRIWRTASGAFLHLVYYDGMEFWVSREGSSIWAVWPKNSSLEDAATFLLGPVFGLLLRLRGVPCLHASAVAVGGHAIAFAGEEGAGKSTTAAAFAQRGHEVLSDDVVALVEREGEFDVLPAYPYLCLWPDAVAKLYGPHKSLPKFSPNWDKRLLSLAGNRLRFKERSLPLGAVFVLGQRGSEAGAPFLEKMTQREGIVALVTNSYATSLLDMEMRAQEFRLLGRLVASVPVWELRAHEHPEQMGRLCEVVLGALKSRDSAGAV